MDPIFSIILYTLTTDKSTLYIKDLRTNKTGS